MFVLLVLTLFTAINTNMAGAQSDTFNTTCSPFRLHVIWHTSNGEDAAFIEQKRLIIQLLLNIPQGTEIHVTALDTRRYNLLHFKKNETTDWIFNINSRLICDYDEVWARNRCVSCSYICSADTKNQDGCLALCPYYRRPSLENADNETDKNVTCQSDKTNTDRILLFFFLIFSALATVSFVAVYMKCGRLKLRILKQHSTANLKRKHLKTSRTHDEIELRAQQETIHLKSSEGN